LSICPAVYTKYLSLYLFLSTINAQPLNSLQCFSPIETSSIHLTLTCRGDSFVHSSQSTSTCLPPHLHILPSNHIETPNRLTPILLLYLRRNRAVKRSVAIVHLPNINPCHLPHLLKLSALRLLIRADYETWLMRTKLFKILASNGFRRSWRINRL
jgi:hypothetical protein